MKDSIQEQLAAARRDQILDAATHVFAERGFHPTTIKDIAREAGIADGTIYKYLENKTALLLGILDRMRESVLREIELPALGEGDVRTALRAYIAHALSAFDGEHFMLFRVLMSEVLVNAELRARYYERVLEPTLALAEPLFEAWAASGAIKTARPGLTLRILSSLISGVILERILGDATLAEHWDVLPDQLADLLTSGLEGASS